MSVKGVPRRGTASSHGLTDEVLPDSLVLAYVLEGWLLVSESLHLRAPSVQASRIPKTALGSPISHWHILALPVFLH